MTPAAPSAARPGVARVRGETVLAALLLLALPALRLWEASGLPFAPCRFLELTRLPCPTCGATRAMLALGRGDFARALALNPLVVLLLTGFLLSRLAPGSLRKRAAHAFARILPARRERFAAAALLVAAQWIYLVFTLPR